MSVVSVDLNPGSIIDGLKNLVDEIWTSDEERLQAKAVLEKLGHAERMGQVQINVQEAKHSSVFVAGWRPFVGWVCGIGLLYAVVVQHLLAWVLLNLPTEVTAPPDLDIASLITILLAMLGVYGMRSNERIKGKA